MNAKQARKKSRLRLTTPGATSSRILQVPTSRSKTRRNKILRRAAFCTITLLLLIAIGVTRGASSVAVSRAEAEAALTEDPSYPELDPRSDKAFVVSLRVRFAQLPAGNARNILLSKYDRRERLGERGWAISLRRF